MPSGRRFPLAFGTYTRRTGTGFQEEIVWWTQTAISARVFDDSATCPSIPAVLRPALRCVTWRTLTSVFDQDRSIIFCSDRTVAQSCSRVALKILRRNRPTLPSCSRQSMASQSSTSSGPFTVTVSNLPFGSGGLISVSVQRLTCPRQPPFGPATRAGIRPVIPAAGGGASHDAVVSCCLSATGIRLLGILLPPRSSAPLTVGLPSNQRLDPTGFPRSAHPSHGRIGCPLYPGAQRCSHGRSDPSGRRSPPLPGARPYHPGVHPISGAVYYEASSRVHSHSPARPSPLPVVPGWIADFLGLLPGLRTPTGRTCGARQGGGRASSTRPELHDRHRRTSNP